MTTTFNPATTVIPTVGTPNYTKLLNFSNPAQSNALSSGFSTDAFNISAPSLDKLGLDFGQAGGKSPTSFFNPNKDGFNYKSLVDILGAGAGIFNSYLGAKALSESKRQAKFNEGVVSANLLAQSKLTNEQLATRDITREKGGFNDGLTHDQFVAKYSVPGTVGG